jgi:uncharacterized protein DUF2797
MLAASEVVSLDRCVLAGYGCSERGPYLVLDGLDHVPWKRQHIAVRGRTFTLEASAERHCTGRYDLSSGEASACPIRSTPLDNADQCSACFSATGFNPAFYHAAHVSSQQRRRNRQPHVVYLASFGVGTLKVGITHAPRRLSRLLEQGARLGAVIASFEDADRARELEAMIASNFEVSESVRAARKRHLLGAPFAPHVARLELARMIESIAQASPDVDPHPELLELDRHYADPDSFAGALTDLSDTDPAGISGRCLGMIGDILLVAEGTQRFMLSVGGLVSRRVRLGREARANHFVGQLGLPF